MPHSRYSRCCSLSPTQSPRPSLALEKSSGHGEALERTTRSWSELDILSNWTRVTLLVARNTPRNWPAGIEELRILVGTIYTNLTSTTDRIWMCTRARRPPPRLLLTLGTAKRTQVTRGTPALGPTTTPRWSGRAPHGSAWLAHRAELERCTSWRFILQREIM